MHLVPESFVFPKAQIHTCNLTAGHFLIPTKQGFTMNFRGFAVLPSNWPEESQWLYLANIVRIVTNQRCQTGLTNLVELL